MGRVTMVMAPTMTVSREITIATIGRLIKNFDIIPPRGFAPRTPLHARSRGPAIPTPLAWSHSRARSPGAYAVLKPLLPSLRRLRGDDIDDRSVSCLQQAFDDHAFAGFQAVGHNPEISDA